MTEQTLDPNGILTKAEALRGTLSTGFRDEIVKSLYREAETIAKRAVKTALAKKYDLDQKIDRLVTSPLVGLPIMLILLSIIIWLTVSGANVASAWLATILFSVGDWGRALFNQIGMPWWITGFLWDGVYLALAWVISVMLPPMAIFFPAFTFMEDLGYLPRVAFNLDWMFKKARAHGQQSLTMAMVENLAGIGKPSVVAYPAGDRLPQTISDAQIAARAIKPGPLQIFFLGNLNPRKGLHILLQALERLPREAWKLAVAGSLEVDRSYAATILRQVHSARLDGQVLFLGPLRDAELVQQFVWSQVMAVPSSYEGFGIAYLEGMGFGLPAIATTRGAAREIITQGENGYLIAPDDPQDLAEHLLLLAEDRDLLIRLSLGARQRFTAHPTWEQTTERIRDFLGEAAERPIHGTATLSEVKELAEEGVPCIPLPKPELDS